MLQMKRMHQKEIKHNKTDCSPNKKIGEGQFCFACDVIPGQETEAEVLRSEWREQNKDVNTSTEKEKNAVNDKAKQDNSENCENEKNNKVSEVVDLEDYFQIEFVDGEPVFACNICNEGFNNEAEIREHMNDKHKSLMSDDLNDTDLYKGFDEDGNRIV